MDTQNYVVSLKALLDAGYSQTDLAGKLGVTHAALNRWLHGRAVPHMRHQNSLHQLSQEKGFLNHLEKGPDWGKFEIQFENVRGEYNVIDKIQRNAYLKNEIVLRMTFNTNKIEGSTLTVKDTQHILFDNQVVPRHSLVEHLEVTNHGIALRNMLQAVELEVPISLQYILGMHSSLMTGILENAGQLRTHPVRIVGSRVVTSNHHKLQAKIPELTTQMATVKSPLAMIVHHAIFEQHHPFSDGNGRVGRLLLNHQLLAVNYSPIIIRAEHKIKYYDALEKAQAKQIFEPLIVFCLEELEETNRLLTA